MNFFCTRLIRGLLTVLLIGINTLVDVHAGTLVDAAKKQDWMTVQTLLKQERDVNQPQGDGTTALAWAVYWDHRDTVESLVRAKANVNASNYIGVTPLILAVRNRNPVIAGLLLQAGADPNKATWSGETALMTAARVGVIETIKLLLDHGADIHAQDPRRGQTALMWAISFGHPAAARVLIERGADISARTIRLKEAEEYTPMLMEGYGGSVTGIAQGGYTPLMFAARVGDLATAKLLLDRGADINTAAVEDGTPLVIASAWGHEDLALLLLDEGADPNIPDANGMTALHYAMREGLKTLLGYDLVVTTHVCGFKSVNPCKPMQALSDQDRTALKDPASGLYVVEGEQKNIDYDGRNRVILPGRNMHELAEALLAHGADVNAAIKYPPAMLRVDHLSWLNLAGATPVLFAVASLDESALETLLEHGADPQVKTEVNHAVFNKQTENHADDNQVLGNGTPLMVAVGLGRQNRFTAEEEKRALVVAKRLLDLGADINEATATGWTALHAAAFNGSDMLIRFLVENGANLDTQNGCGRTPLSLASAENDAGLVARSRAKQPTVELLRSLGAGKTEPAGPVGVCVLGRYQYQPTEE